MAVYVTAGNGCGDFYGSILNFFTLKTKTPIDIGVPDNFFLDSFINDHRPYVAIDIDRNGFPEFIGYNKIMFKDKKKWKVFELRIPYDDCPC